MARKISKKTQSCNQIFVHYDGAHGEGMKSAPGFLVKDAQKGGWEFRALRRTESYIIYIMYITYILYIHYITFADSGSDSGTQFHHFRTVFGSRPVSRRQSAFRPSGCCCRHWYTLFWAAGLPFPSRQSFFPCCRTLISLIALAISRWSDCFCQFRLFTGIVIPESLAISSLGNVT